MKFKRIYFYGIIAIAFLLYFVISIIKIWHIDKSVIWTKKTNLYAQIFIKSDLIKSDLTYFNKTKLPIATFNYDGKYKIIVSSFKINQKTNLQELIRLNTGQSHPTIGVIYNSILFLNSFNYQSNINSNPQICQRLNLSISGDSLKVKAKNNFLSYHLILDNLSIKFNSEQDVELFASSKEKALNAQILFLKRFDHLYFILMIPNNKKIKTNNNLLFDLIKN
ncbi:hypothetical protein [Pedobacter rhodius]|uniref:Transmembrane protein n=1 Tax=Pedobacter rhodius TaxID=3004098 RepID=A0ABT4L2P4_9SPHI|nr:hypothetical protein [Pedobacter sp. SJ11]MCZ4224657.1 hypothetical protein [Pedobacter sp. SJ11]